MAKAWWIGREYIKIIAGEISMGYQHLYFLRVQLRLNASIALSLSRRRLDATCFTRLKLVQMTIIIIVPTSVDPPLFDVNTIPRFHHKAIIQYFATLTKRFHAAG